MQSEESEVLQITSAVGAVAAHDSRNLRGLAARLPTLRAIDGAAGSAPLLAGENLRTALIPSPLSAFSARRAAASEHSRGR